MQHLRNSLHDNILGAHVLYCKYTEMICMRSYSNEQNSSNLYIYSCVVIFVGYFLFLLLVSYPAQHVSTLYKDMDNLSSVRLG